MGERCDEFLEKRGYAAVGTTEGPCVRGVELAVLLSTGFGNERDRDHDTGRPSIPIHDHPRVPPPPTVLKRNTASPRKSQQAAHVAAGPL